MLRVPHGRVAQGRGAPGGGQPLGVARCFPAANTLPGPQKSDNGLLHVQDMLYLKKTKDRKKKYYPVNCFLQRVVEFEVFPSLCSVLMGTSSPHQNPCRFSSIRRVDEIKLGGLYGQVGLHLGNGRIHRLTSGL